MKQKNFVRRAAASTVVVPAVLLAAACGSAEPAPATTTASQAPAATTPSQAPASSVPSTSPAPETSAAPTSGAPVADGQGDKAEFISKLKAGSADASSVHLAMNIKGAGQSVKMDADSKLEGSNPSVQMSMGASGLDLQVRVVDKKVYLKGLPNNPAGKWGVYDERSKTGREFTKSIDQAGPSALAEQFDKSLTKVEKIGTEKVDGEDMDKYALSLDAKKALGDLADNPAAGSIPKSLDYTAWVDSKNRLRKVTFKLLGIDSTINLSKYGEPVEITAPPARDVVKGKEL